MHHPRTLLAIPVYNESAHLMAVLTEAGRYVSDILVIDDGSTDGTGQLLTDQRLAKVLRHSRNLGYGRSVADAFVYAADEDYDWLITMDCDWQHEPSFVPHFLAAAGMGSADIISGSRYLHRFEDNSLPPSDRRRINSIITKRLNALLGLGISDAFCGFKAYRVEGLKRLHITEPGYAMPIQFWIQAWDQGLRIREIPVRLIYNDPTRHFGGALDDPDRRLRHYEAVMQAELRAAFSRAPAALCTSADTDSGHSLCGCDR